MGTTTITKVIKTFEASEDQEDVIKEAIDLMDAIRYIYRYGRMQLIWHDGRLVRLEVERSEKDLVGEKK